MFQNQSLIKVDNIGALASGLCLIHCVATPFLFVAQAATCSAAAACCDASPAWWGWLDYGFLAISLLAVYFSAQHSPISWMPSALYTSWFVLGLIILNERMGWMELIEEAIYIPAMSLVVLHLYNRRQCQCADDACCHDATSGS